MLRGMSSLLDSTTMTFPHVIDGHNGNRPVLFAALFVLFAFLFAGHSLAQAPAAAQPASPSGLRLVGTVEGAPFSGAVLDDGTGTQTFYGLHDALPDGSRIIKVHGDSILLKQPDGTVYELFIAQNIRTAVPLPDRSSAGPIVQDNPAEKAGNGQERATRRGRSKKIMEAE
jgi:hypothetical protein